VLHIRNDPRSDLFALGVLLYHLTTGERPFGAPTSVGGLRKRLYNAPVPPRVRRPDCPPWLQEVILHCLEVNPADRYGSAAQIAFDLTHTSDIALTARAGRVLETGFGGRFKRWFRSIGAEPLVQTVSQQLASAPIVVAAVDLSQEWEALADAVRTVVRRVIQHDTKARLACIAVLKTQRIGMDVLTDRDGGSLHVKRLIELKHWAKPLGLPQERVTYHVLEAYDVADAILTYAQSNNVDQIVIGSRGSASLRRYLGSVSAKVVAEAACTVTVVKPPRSSNTEDEAAPPAAEAA
jgi:nucleotide-binding universal stress UspA family protein